MQIKQTIHHNLIQLEHILTELSDKEYSQSLPLLNGQTIGKHVRHIIEFYICLIDAEEYVCYDDRKRDERIETSTEYTIRLIEMIMDKLEVLDYNLTTQLKQLVNDEVFIIPTSFGREMIYCIDHSIHHFAIIKIALKTYFNQIQLSENFGIAYSTIKYNQNR